MSQPDYFTNTVADAARYAADHADPVEVDGERDGPCGCHYPGENRPDSVVCRRHEEGDDE